MRDIGTLKTKGSVNALLGIEVVSALHAHGQKAIHADAFRRGAAREVLLRVPKCGAHNESCRKC